MRQRPRKDEESDYIEGASKPLVSNKMNSPMKNRRYREETYITEQLPISASVSLYSGINSRPVKKLKKEEPEIWEGVKTLLHEDKIRLANKILVRENGFGLLPVLLAKQYKDKRFFISTWSKEVHPTIRRNLEANLVEGQFSLSVEGRVQTHTADIAVLVHERFQSHTTTLSELVSLLKQTSDGVVYIVSHKNKGIETLLEMAKERGITKFNVLSRGLGGVRIVRVEHSSGVDNSEELKEIKYKLGNHLLIFSTSSSLFSPQRVDAGTDLLINYVLSITRNSQYMTAYDVACGYGAIGISIAKVRPHFMIYMSDVDARAVELAQSNISKNKVKERVKVVLSDGAQEVKETFDFVLSNPPLHVNRSKLTEIIVNARKRVKHGGRMCIVIEDSRVSEIRDLVHPYIGYLKEVERSRSYSVLETQK